MKIAITGATGHIGRQLVRELRTKPYELSLWSLSENPNTLSADLSTESGVDRLMSQGPYDIIVHLAAQSKPHLAVNEPDLNKSAIELILQQISTSTHVLFASSSHVYGSMSELPVSTSHPLRPRTEYGRQKLRAEMHCRAYINTSILRFFNCIGFPPKEGTFLYDWTSQIRNGMSPIIVKNADVDIDLITTEDAAKAIVEVIQAEIKPRIINVCSGKCINLRETLDKSKANYISTGNKKLKSLGEPDWLRSTQWKTNQDIQALIVDYLNEQLMIK